MNREERRALKRAVKGHAKPLVRRKIWSTSIDPVAHAIAGAGITDRASLDQLLTRELASLDAFTRGAATMREWSDMVNVNNLTQTLSGMGVGREAMPDAHKAEQGLIEAAKRFERTGKMGLSGPAIQALREVIEWHDLQRSSISRSLYEKAIDETEKVVRSKGRDVTDIQDIIDSDKTLGQPKEQPCTT